jgi:hypothetical protein
MGQLPCVKRGAEESCFVLVLLYRWTRGNRKSNSGVDVHVWEATVHIMY